jgi:hydroxymethylbilane synthase
MNRIRIGSRGSQLALWQARWVESRLQELGAPTELEIIKTTGDRIQDVPLGQVGSKGLFTKEIEDALLAGTIDLAVHSLKDMPTELPGGLALAASPEREDPRDVLVGAKLADLPRGARVGTGSNRRVSQLKAVRPDLDIQNIRGNVDTRLRKLDEGQFDCIVLAAAGLRRLGFAARITEYLDPGIVCPAVGQGALALETRADRCDVAEPLNHAGTWMAVRAERALLRALGGGCQVPIGAHARAENGSLHLTAVVAAPDGSRILRDELAGSASDAERLGAELGARLLGAGAAAILNSASA